MKRILLFLSLLLSTVATVYADCETDRFGVVFCGRGHCAQDKKGDVYCSKYLHGDALLDKHGNVVCGKGQCLPSIKFDDFYCSAIESGGAKLDRTATVKCYGGCDKASASMCERQPGK